MSVRWPLWKRRTDRDFRDEIDSHLTIEAERLMSQDGLTSSDARAAARRAFGNVAHAQERFHEGRGWAWLERARQHVTLSARTHRNSPMFCLAAVLTLGVGIGANTAIFTMLYSVAMRPLPARGADRLVNVYQQYRGKFSREVNGFPSQISYPEFLEYRRRARSLQSSAVYAQTDFASSGSTDGSIRAGYVSCDYFQTLDARVILGRSFTGDECARLGAPRVAVISYRLWKSQFGGDRGIIGQSIDLNRIPVTVVGVAEPGFAGIELQSVDTWVPATLQLALTHGQDSLVVREASWMTMVGRLAPGATIDQARAELSVIARQQDARFPGRITTVIVSPGAYLNFPEAHRQGAMAGGLVALLGVLIVVIACANVMNLLLARGVTRRREIGIRLALGATRQRLVEQLVVESLFLAALGGLLGAFIAYMLPPIVDRVSPLAGLHIDVTPDANVLFFTLLTSVTTALVFGLAPAFQATSMDLVSAFKGLTSFGSRQVKPSRLRNAVVGVQVGVSTLLLVLAALFFRAARHASGVDPGYATQNVMSFQLNLAQLGYDGSRASATYQALTGRIAAIPGVEGVGLASQMPLLVRNTESIQLPDSGTGTWGTRLTSGFFMFASSGYFRAMRIPLVRGNALDDRFAASGAPGAVVSASIAETLWPHSEPLGRRIRVGSREYTVTGVAANVRMLSLASETDPFVYLSTPPMSNSLLLVVRTSGPNAAVDRMLRDIVRELDPQVTVRSERFEDRIATAMRPARVAAAVAAAAGGLALLLAVIGVYGVVSYAVGQRTQEIAVRLALGATGSAVMALILRQGARPLVIGVLAGITLAAGVSQALRSLLLGVSPLDPIAYVGMAALLLGTSFAAMFGPAHRASRVDPARTLRQD
jgi:putative ABC transport system permease protein